MAKIALLKRAADLWSPAEEETAERLQRVRVGEVLVGEFKKPRNQGHHRKLFALLGIMFDNQRRFTNRNDMLVDVKLKCGHYTEYITTDGKVVYVPKSISYGEMDQLDFDPFYQAVVRLSLTDPTYMCGLDEFALNAEIERRAAF